MRRHRELSWIMAGVLVAGVLVAPAASPKAGWAARPAVVPSSATAPGAGSGSTWTAVSVGSRHVCAIATAGSVWCWGELPSHSGKNLGGQAPRQVGSATDWLSVTSGHGYSCGIRADHSLWCWGSVDFGTETADGVERTAAKISWQTASAGGGHVCGLSLDSALWCFGDNAFGQLGDGTDQQRPDPVQVGTDRDWRQVQASRMSTCALRGTGALWCWGNLHGRYDDGELPPTAVVPDRVWNSFWHDQSIDCAVAVDRRLWCWGYNTFPGDGTIGLVDGLVAAGGDTTWTTVVTTEEFRCGIKLDTTLWCWGHNDYGQLGMSTPGYQLTPAPVEADAGWASVSVSDIQSVMCGIRLDQTLWCWGDDRYDQLGNASPLNSNETTTPVRVDVSTRWWSVAAGTFHTCAIDGAAALWCWGHDDEGQLGDAANTDRYQPARVMPDRTWATVSARTKATCAIATDGTLWCWGGHWLDAARNAPAQIGSDRTWASVSAPDWDHGCAIRTDHTLWCWGGNQWGQLGDATTTDRDQPVAVAGGRTWETVNAGEQNTCAIATDHTLWCWGNLDWMEYGPDGPSGNVESRTSPVQISSATTWSTLWERDSHRCALRTDSGLWCWAPGYGAPYLLSEPTQGTGIDGRGWVGFALSVQTTGRTYDSHGYFLRADHTLWSTTPLTRFGTNTWVALAGGYEHACAIATDDTLWCWGSNRNGQLGHTTPGMFRLVRRPRLSRFRSWSGD